MSQGKPSFPRGQSQPYQIMLRLSPEEHDDIIKKANELGHTFPDTIRVHLGWDPRYYPKRKRQPE